MATTDYAWHARTLPTVLELLHAAREGLSTVEAAHRLTTVGSNALPDARATPAWRILLRQFRSVVVGLLLASAVVAAAMDDRADAAAIAAILILNVGLGFAIEMRARRAVEALARLEPRRATVLRDRTPVEIDARAIVPGDVLVLEPGQTVAADARLLAGTELRTMESALTGESLPVTKRDQASLDVHTPLPERQNMVFAGTTVVAGAGHAVVVSTGAATELGIVGKLVLSTTAPETPLERRLDALGRQLVWLALAAGLLVAIVGLLRGAGPSLMLQTALALAVAAVPEGLPVVATMALGLGVHRMARRRALVRRLPVVEALGSVTVICTDKTGTLTAGAMTVTSVVAGGDEFVVGGLGYAPLGDIHSVDANVGAARHPALLRVLEIAALGGHADVVSNDGDWIVRGDPTEAALVTLARKAGIEPQRSFNNLSPVGEVPFSSERKWTARFYRDASGVIAAYVKGAPDRILDLCTRLRTRDGECALDAAAREQVLARNRDMARQGLRVLGLAYGTATEWRGGVPDLTFAGLVGMMDQPADGVRETIARFREAGISTVMLTGDQRLTAEAVARDIGLESTGPTPSAAELEAMSDQELERAVADTVVFSRVSPALKLRIVSAYQRLGQIVAMLGDGVNDAAALKKADVGVTMGRRGTDVARETAAVVLADDRFETIGVAIEEGRVIFDNIRKFVFYLFSCNLAEIIVLVGATAVGLPLPLQPLQILWLNLVTDTLPALSLVLEPAEPDVMRRPPRDPATGLLSQRFARGVMLYAALIAAATFAVVLMATAQGADPAKVATLAFTTLALAQTFHLGNARSRGPVVQPARVTDNRAAIAAVVVTVGLLLAAVYWMPLVAILGGTELDLTDWMVVVPASLVPAVVGQTLKAARSTVQPPPPRALKVAS